MSEGKEKRSRGRPKLPPGLKADQFSIALPSPVRLGLEMLARHRGVSLSKAVEYCVSLTLRNYEIGGEALARRLHVEVPIGYGSPDEAWASQLLASQGLRALWMPEELRTPEESYFVRVVDLLGGRGSAEQVEGDIDRLWAIARTAFAQGVQEAALAAHWKDEMGVEGAF